LSIELLVQFLVLAATAALFWVARRDLASRREAAPPPAPPGEEAVHLAELEQLCATLEALATSLARRLDAVERQLAVERLAVERLPPTIQAADAAASEAAAPLSPQAAPLAVSDLLHVSRVAAPEPSPPGDLPLDPRHLSAYALLQAGMTDPVEIARQTGLGRGEVDLILSLRARRAL